MDELPERQVVIQGDSEYAVAYALFLHLFRDRNRQQGTPPDQLWLFKTYADCLQAVRGKPPG